MKCRFAKFLFKAFGITGEEKHAFFIPKLMSRKKQIIPMLTALWG